MGIAKIDTNKKIEKDAARQVTFSKRRTGLFKKAFELSVLCDLELAIVVFSQKGKVFSFAHPEIHHVIAKYRDAEDVKPFDEQKLQEIHLRVEQLIPLYDHVIEQSKIGKEQNQCLKQLNTKLAQRSWTPVDVETMSLQQLQHHSEELQKLIDYHDAYRQHHQSSFYGGFMHQNPQPHFHLPPPSEPPPQLSQPPQPSQHEDRHGLADPNQQPWPQQWHPAGMPAAMRTMQWQQPSSSNNNDHRNPNFSTGIRPAMGSQNFMYYAPEPTPIQRGNYHGQQPSHSAGVPDDRIQLHRPAMYYDQQQQAQQEQEQEQQLVTDGDQMASRYLAQSYVHQYEPVDHQNQQSRYTENMQLGRAYNELNSFYSPFMPPAEQQLHPGVYDTQVHGHAYPYNSGAEPAFAHQESFFQEGSSQILLFSLPYDPFAHAPMVPADEAAYRNSVNIGTIRAQSSRDNQAHVACEITGRNDGREVNSGPSSHPSDDSTDSSEALKNKSARCNIGIATGPDTAYNA